MSLFPLNKTASEWCKENIGDNEMITEKQKDNLKPGDKLLLKTANMQYGMELTVQKIATKFKNRTAFWDIDEDVNFDDPWVITGHESEYTLLDVEE